MLKRMIGMLTVTMVIVAGLGFVKFQQIQTAIAEGAAFQPPPEAVTTVVAQQEEWPRHVERDRHDGGGAGRDSQRRSSGHGRADFLRFRARGARRRRARRSRHPAGAGATRGDRGAPRVGAAHLRRACRSC